jgi:hypothetical protein
MKKTLHFKQWHTANGKCLVHLTPMYSLKHINESAHKHTRTQLDCPAKQVQPDQGMALKPTHPCMQLTKLQQS